MFAIFNDLKVVYDKVDKSKLWRIIKAKAIDKGLIRKMRKIYMKKDDENEEKTSVFETRKRVM